MVTTTTDTITSAKLAIPANLARLTAKGSISAHFPTDNTSVKATDTITMAAITSIKVTAANNLRRL